MAPVVLFLMGDALLWAWLAMVVPGLAYASTLVVSGAFGDAWLQLTAHSELKKVGFDRFYDSVEMLRGVYWASWQRYRSRERTTRTAAGSIGFASAPPRNS